MHPDSRTRYERAIDITRRASQVALGYFDRNISVEFKGDSSPVTVADRETELALRSALSDAFPGDGFLGEEYGDTPGTTGYRWILDPIDGTRAYVRNVPIWATLVGLEYKGELIAGVVEAAALGHTYHALRGQGAYRNDRRIRVSDIDELSRSLVYYSSLAWFLKAGKEREFIDLVKKSEKQRGYGDWYGFMLVAQGSGEVMVEHGVHAWDVAALAPIVEEAGGKFTNWDARFDIDKPDVLATNGKLHADVLAIMGGPVGS